MKTKSPDEQIAALRGAETLGFARHLHRWMIGSAVVLIGLGAAIWNPVPLMLALFLGVVGLAERRAIPNVLAALQAYDTMAPTEGEVSIRVTRWSDDNHYHAFVSEPGRPAWEYEFIPQGWQPEEGAVKVRIWRLPGHEAPSLAATPEGILIPRYDPKRLDT